MLGFIAPSLSVVFLLSVFWRKTTKKAVNFTLSYGSAFSLGIGVIYLWILPPSTHHFWPHYLMLSFLIFAILFIAAIIISLIDKTPETNAQIVDVANFPITTKRVKLLWALLGVTIVCLYFFFNGH